IARIAPGTVVHEAYADLPDGAGLPDMERTPLGVCDHCERGSPLAATVIRNERRVGGCYGQRLDPIDEPVQGYQRRVVEAAGRLPDHLLTGENGAPVVGALEHDLRGVGCKCPVLVTLPAVRVPEHVSIG